MPPDLTNRTIQDFGEQWQAYPDTDGYFGSLDLLRDFVEPLLPVTEITGRRVAEVGSGSGRIVNMLLAAGAAHVTAVEPSAAFTVLQQNVRDHDRVTFLHVSGEELPAAGDLDLVFFLGVVHHIPDPRPAVARARAALRPGGRVVVWLYAHEGNGLYLAVAQPLRCLTRRLPHQVLVLLAAAWSLPLWVYARLCRWLPLPLHRYMTQVLCKLPRRHLELVIYDQLNPAYAKYYRREEALELLTAAGFTDVRIHHRHHYSWLLVGTAPAGPLP